MRRLSFASAVGPRWAVCAPLASRRVAQCRLSLRSNTSVDRQTASGRTAVPIRAEYRGVVAAVAAAFAVLLRGAGVVRMLHVLGLVVRRGRQCR